MCDTKNFQHLVDEGENVNYNSMDQAGAAMEPEAGPSEGKSQTETHASDVKERRRKISRDKNTKRAPLVSLFMYAMKQSYVLMLIAMMVSWMKAGYEVIHDEWSEGMLWVRWRWVDWRSAMRSLVVKECYEVRNGIDSWNCVGSVYGDSGFHLVFDFVPSMSWGICLEVFLLVIM